MADTPTGAAITVTGNNRSCSRGRPVAFVRLAKADDRGSTILKNPTAQLLF
jgi:hypothetical protein